MTSDTNDKNIRISSAQFENKSGDKEYNLSVMTNLLHRQHYRVHMLLHFMNVPLQDTHLHGTLQKEQLLDISEFIPSGLVYKN